MMSMYYFDMTTELLEWGLILRASFPLAKGVYDSLYHWLALKAHLEAGKLIYQKPTKQDVSFLNI